MPVCLCVKVSSVCLSLMLLHNVKSPTGTLILHHRWINLEVKIVMMAEFLTLFTSDLSRVCYLSNGLNFKNLIHFFADVTSTKT